MAFFTEPSRTSKHFQHDSNPFHVQFPELSIELSSIDEQLTCRTLLEQNPISGFPMHPLPLGPIQSPPTPKSPSNTYTPRYLAAQPQLRHKEDDYEKLGNAALLIDSVPDFSTPGHKFGRGVDTNTVCRFFNNRRRIRELAMDKAKEADIRSFFSPVNAGNPVTTKITSPRDEEFDLDKPKTQSSSYRQLICICHKPARTCKVALTQCANPVCAVDWYHKDCLDKAGKRKARHGTYLCEQCALAQGFCEREEQEGRKIEGVMKKTSAHVLSAAALGSAEAACFGLPVSMPYQVYEVYTNVAVQGPRVDAEPEYVSAYGCASDGWDEEMWEGNGEEDEDEGPWL